MLIGILATIENESDKDKCVTLYEKYKGLMMHIALQSTRSQHLAEDMVSESMIKIIKHLDKIYSLDCYQQQQYIVLIVKNTCLDYFKKANRNQAESIDALDEDYRITIADETATNPLDDLLIKDGYEAIVSAIKALPDTYKDVAYLYFVHEHNYHEIAKILNISYDNAKMRLSRAKTIVKQKIKGEVVR